MTPYTDCSEIDCAESHKLSLLWQHDDQTKALKMELSLLLETGFWLSA
jgi:hypothetical protein